MSQDDFVEYLDNGYVRFLGSFGSDELVAKFARCSFVNQDKEYTKKQDIGLINYLFEHKHTSPIESCNISFEIKMPLFVAQQHIRHRTASLNQQSLRYSVHDGDYYVPDLDQMRTNDKWNKQGSGDLLDPLSQHYCQQVIDEQLHDQYKAYEDLIKRGLTKEQARGILGTNFYTVICWQMDTKNLFHYLALRNDGHAQWEIQQLAKIIDSFVRREFPLLCDAFDKFWKNAKTFSEPELEVLRKYVDIEKLKEEIDSVGGSKRRAKDLIKKLEG